MCLHIKLEIVLLRSIKYCIGNSMGFTLSLQIAFGRVAIFNTLMLPIHVQGRFFHLLMVSTISFSNVVNVLLYKSFICLVKIIPR